MRPTAVSDTVGHRPGVLALEGLFHATGRLLAVLEQAPYAGLTRSRW